MEEIHVPDSHWFSQVMQQTAERVEVAWLKACRSGYEHPVLLVLDLTDPLGHQISRTIGRDDEAETFIARTKQHSITPFMVVGVPDDQAVEHLTDDVTQSTKILAEWSTLRAAGMIPIVLVSDGVTGLTWRPVPET